MAFLGSGTQKVLRIGPKKPLNECRHLGFLQPQIRVWGLGRCPSRPRACSAALSDLSLEHRLWSLWLICTKCIFKNFQASRTSSGKQVFLLCWRDRSGLPALCLSHLTPAHLALQIPIVRLELFSEEPDKRNLVAETSAFYGRCHHSHRRAGPSRGPLRMEAQGGLAAAAASAPDRFATPADQKGTSGKVCPRRWCFRESTSGEVLPGRYFWEGVSGKLPPRLLAMDPPGHLRLTAGSISGLGMVQLKVSAFSVWMNEA